MGFFKKYNAPGMSVCSVFFPAETTHIAATTPLADPPPGLMPQNGPAWLSQVFLENIPLAIGSRSSETGHLALDSGRTKPRNSADVLDLGPELFRQ